MCKDDADLIWFNRSDRVASSSGLVRSRSEILLWRTLPMQMKW